MNITHVVENLNRGGLERMVIDLIKQQRAHGHRCQVVCVFESGALAHELDALGVPVVAAGKRRGPDLRALARMRAAIARQGADVVHTHNAVAHYHGVLATLGLGIGPLVTTRHGMGDNHRSRRREWLFRRALGRTRVVVLVCEAARRLAIERGIVPAHRATVVGNGIDIGAFAVASPAARQRWRRTLGLHDGALLVGTVGRLNWAKDQAGLIRALAHLRRRVPQAELVLVGDGELRGELAQFAEREGVATRVHFLGDRSDVPDLLTGLDVFALSSLSEGYSLALLEACAAGLPIVATDVGGNGEIVREGVNGHLVPAGDVDALAAALADLLEQPLRARRFGDAARAWVEQAGSIQAMAARYADIYGVRAG